MAYALYFLSTEDNEAFVFSLFLFFLALITNIAPFPLQSTACTFTPDTLAIGLRGGHTPHWTPTTGGAMSTGLAAVLCNPSACLLLVTLPMGCTEGMLRQGHTALGDTGWLWKSSLNKDSPEPLRNLPQAVLWGLGSFHSTFPSLRVWHAQQSGHSLSLFWLLPHFLSLAFPLIKSLHVISLLVHTFQSTQTHTVYNSMRNQVWESMTW